jgi:hypothetical protein
MNGKPRPALTEPGRRVGFPDVAYDGNQAWQGSGGSVCSGWMNKDSVRERERERERERDPTQTLQA